MCSKLVSVLLYLASSWAVAVAQPATREVTTPAELQTAIADGVQHVVITRHLDFTNVQAIPGSPLSDVVLVVSAATQSIRVRSSVLAFSLRALASG